MKTILRGITVVVGMVMMMAIRMRMMMVVLCRR